MLRLVMIVKFLLFVAPFPFGPAVAQDAKRVEEAKRESGKAVVYGSLDSDIINVIKTAFNKKTGLDIEYWRASATKVMDRAVSEHRAGKALYDVILTTRSPMELMKDAGVFLRYESPSFKAFTPDVLDPFFGPPYAYNVFGLLYNRKTGSDGLLPDRITVGFKAALGACVKLETEPEFQGKLRFKAGSAIFIANDRLHAPNTEESFQALRSDLSAALAKVYPSSVELRRTSADPRSRLTIQLTSSQPVDAAALLSRLA